VPRLRRADTSLPGIVRRRRGRGFTYAWADPDGGPGRPVTEPEVLERIAALVLPPAWTDVWISPWPNGHIQATGVDAAGRRQYRYHDQWRLERDQAKFDRVLSVAALLPAARERASVALAQRGLTRERVLAAAFRLLDLGFFRIGGEEYALEHGSYGLATMRREHVSFDGSSIVFTYTAKHGKEQVQSIVDDEVRAVVKALLRRQDPSPELLGYRTSSGWRDVTSGDINDYLRRVVGADMSAKDFRTWHATVLMAVALAVSEQVPASKSARDRAKARAYREVAAYLGNTPAVARSSYVDPRVVDRYDDGETVFASLLRSATDAEDEGPILHGRVEEAVLRLLSS
jgi:DNA topoisomerase IB